MFKKILALVFILVCFTTAAHAENEYDGYIFKVKDGITPISMLSNGDGNTECIDEELNLFKTTDEDTAKELEKSEIVEYVEPDYRVYLMDYEVSDKYYNDTINNLNWPQKLINCKSAWDKGLFGQNVRIAIVDSGVVSITDSALPENFSDFNINVAKGYDYKAESEVMSDNTGHGTEIIQLIASQNNNSYYIGVAPRSTVVPLRIIHNEFSYVSDVAPVIKDAVDKYDCDIINMSFSLGTMYSQTMKLALDHAYQKGAILVAAAGNYGESATEGTKIHYPAGYDNVIGVGSVNDKMEHSAFSQRNSSVYCCAPGEGITAYHPVLNATGIKWGLYRLGGTSYSAPIVCGVAALLKGINPQMNQDEFMEIIKNTAYNLGDDDGYDELFGYGMIDVDSAIEYMLKDTKTFVSPIYNDYSDTNITITNNTATEQEYTSIWSSDSAYGTKIDTYKVDAGASYTIPYFFDGSRLTHYLVSSISQLKPMSDTKSATRKTN